MKLLKMDKPQCLIFSAAMVLGVSPQDLCAEIGHDGLERVWNLPEPRCFRGHHIQEIQDLFLARGLGLVEVELYPVSGQMGDDLIIPAYDKDTARRRFIRALSGRKGILISPGHACAWDGKIVFDPNGYTYPLERLRPISAYLI